MGNCCGINQNSVLTSSKYQQKGKKPKQLEKQNKQLKIYNNQNIIHSQQNIKSLDDSMKLSMHTKYVKKQVQSLKTIPQNMKKTIQINKQNVDTSQNPQTQSKINIMIDSNNKIGYSKRQLPALVNHNNLSITKQQLNIKQSNSHYVQQQDEKQVQNNASCDFGRTNNNNMLSSVTYKLALNKLAKQSQLNNSKQVNMKNTKTQNNLPSIQSSMLSTRQKKLPFYQNSVININTNSEYKAGTSQNQIAQKQKNANVQEQTQKQSMEYKTKLTMSGLGVKKTESQDEQGQGYE